MRIRCCLSLVGVWVLAGFHLAAAQGLTFNTNTLAADGHPFSVIAAGVNNDRRPDLISANIGNNGTGNTLTVWTNNGSGDFGSNATYTVGGAPTCIAADITGNGKLDLISANANDGTLTILTNNGNGGFGSNATLKVGYGPTCVLAVDINHDGKLDLVSANSGTNTLTVLTNDGSGGFSLSASLTVGNGPYSVVAADTKGIGRQDLITANTRDGTLTVLTNDGSGGFGSNTACTVGDGPRCVVAADINGDGKPDLICANFYGGTLTVLTNDGTGRFGSNATLSALGGAPISMVTADMNGDGKLDLVTANYDGFAGGSLLVLTNDGAGAFGSNTTLGLPPGIGPSCVVAADVNGDGRLDLISANYYDSSTLTIWTQTSILPPLMTITSTATNGILISWSSFSTGFVLQTNSDLTATNWGTSGYPISIANGTNASIAIGSPPGNLFFRLKH